MHQHDSRERGTARQIEEDRLHLQPEKLAVVVNQETKEGNDVLSSRAEARVAEPHRSRAKENNVLVKSMPE